MVGADLVDHPGGLAVVGNVALRLLRPGRAWRLLPKASPRRWSANRGGRVFIAMLWWRKRPALSNRPVVDGGPGAPRRAGVTSFTPD